jgi:hypothetical protein
MGVCPWDKTVCETRGPVLQQVWHVNEPSLLKAVSVKHMYNFAAVNGNGDSHQIAENCSCVYEKNKQTSEPCTLVKRGWK